MTNYERKKNITIEEMASASVYVTRTDTDNNGMKLCFVGNFKNPVNIISLYGDEYNTAREEAVRREIDWLNQEAEDE